MKCPYSFPLRSSIAMINYLLDRRGYADHYTPFPFSWNVKAYCVDCDHPKGCKSNPVFDAAWSAYVQTAPDVYNFAVGDAQEQYVSDWTSYPGADQGDWQFGFYGRSGGHICLETWRGKRLYGRDLDLQDWLDAIPYSDLRVFYRAIVCADQDFTQANASKNVEFCLSFIREQWEEEQEEKLEENARDLEDSRPNLYA